MPEPDDKIKMAVIANDIRYIKRSINEIKKNMDDDYVQKSEFEPIQKIVYAMVGLVLTAVVTAVITLVIKQPI